MIPEQPKQLSKAEEILEVIKKEVEYVLSNEDTNHPHIVSSLNIGGILTAIQYNLNKAQSEWYNNKEPYTSTTDLLRKIAALCVKSGLLYGMPERNNNNQIINHQQRPIH